MIFHKKYTYDSLVRGENNRETMIEDKFTLILIQSKLLYKYVSNSAIINKPSYSLMWPPYGQMMEQWKSHRCLSSLHVPERSQHDHLTVVRVTGDDEKGMRKK